MVKSLKLSYLFCLLTCGLFVACESRNTSVVESVSGPTVELDSLEGMLRVRATGGSITLGTSDKSARASERPEMGVVFDYDFSIGRAEVTCGEFNKLQRASGLVLDCENDSLPASDLTYYDAVLFANQKSKLGKKDTAYTYSSANFDSDGHCTNLDGFVFHPEVEGFRLPTEAEWVYVARDGWSPDGSWTSDNSGYEKQKVCSRQFDSTSVCDIAGNVMEWVNDWLGYFVDSTVTNYVGAPDGGSLGQRVVKGGSYRDSPESINLYSRSDVYTVTSSTKAAYVGFRLAYGKIPNAVWIGDNGVTAQSRVVPLAGSSIVKNLVGTYRAKLAFRNDVTGNLDVIDYSSGVVSVVEIRDSIDAYHPAISPDGKKVAFCTGMEGVSGKSSIYVRDLNSVGDNLVKLDVESAVIPRWIIFDGDTSIVYVTSAGDNEVTGNFMDQSTWVVSFQNGKFGKPRKLFDGAYHGGVDDLGEFAVTGSKLLRARVAGGDSVWYNQEQACNVSLSKDGSKRTLFLDFGGKTGKDFAGTSYRTHERILIADSLGNLIQSIPSPSGYTFDHTEWVGENLIIATLANMNGAHGKIVVVNALDSSVTDLAEGDELWHPDFWYKASAIGSDETLLNFDSAGVYFTPDVPSYGLELRIKMESFWTKLDSTSVVALGSSRVMFGVNEQMVQSEKLVNMAYSSGDMPGMHYLFMNYVLKHSKAKKVVLEFSPDFMIVDVLISWNPLYASSPGIQYDERHQFWPDGVSESFVEAVKTSYKPVEMISLPYTVDEFLLPSVGWGKATVFRDTSMVERVFAESVTENLRLLREIVAAAKSNDVQLILLITPQNPGYRNTGAFGLYGVSRSLALALIDSVKTMDVILMDENKMGLHDYTDNMAYNTDHLSRAGAAQLSSRLDSLLQTLK